MTEQGKQEWMGKTLYRWKLETSEGKKLTWAETEEKAVQKAENKGLVVYTIRPSESGDNA